MAHRSAGTVVTTHKATYIPPHLSPGYSGFLPALRHQYGETYGRATTRNFYTDRARQVMLIEPHKSENHPYTPIIKRRSPPGQPPCLNKSYTSDDCTFTPVTNREKFGRNSVILAKSLNRDRVESLDKMMNDCMEHRRSYKDITGLTPRVKFFVIPTEFGNRCMGQRRTSYESAQMSSAAQYNNRSRTMPVTNRSMTMYRSSNRERAMRDLHFEHR